MTKEKILITGGAGYIGSILVEDLLSHNFEVTVYDNFLYSQNSIGHLCHNTDLTIEKGDVRDFKKLNNLIKQNDIIIPLAALVGAPICNFDPVGSKSINHDSVLKLFKCISNDQKIIMPTTNSAYGAGDENNYCDENSPLKPISNYAKDKVLIEEDLRSKENFISFRLATVFGVSPRMRIDLLVNDFVYRAINDKFIVLFEAHFKRNFIHVRDVSNAFIHSILNFEQMKNQVYNVGLSNANLSKLELCKFIKKYLKDFVFFEDTFNKDPDQRNYIVSNKKIENTGFTPKYSLDYGIKELIKGYKYLKKNNHSNF